MANDLDERIRYQLCQTNELHNGQMKEFEVRTAGVQANVLLIRQNEQFYAYANKCCHYKLPLVKGMKREREIFVLIRRTLCDWLGVLFGNHLRCFAHGACFQVDTGDIEDHPGHGNLPSMFKTHWIVLC